MDIYHAAMQSRCLWVLGSKQLQAAQKSVEIYLFDFKECNDEALVQLSIFIRLSVGQEDLHLSLCFRI